MKIVLISGLTNTNTNFAFVCQFKDLDMFKAELVELNLELVSVSQENLFEFVKRHHL